MNDNLLLSPLSNSTFYRCEVDVEKKNVYLLLPSGSYRIELSSAALKGVDKKVAAAIHAFADDLYRDEQRRHLAKRVTEKKGQPPFVTALHSSLQGFFHRELPIYHMAATLQRSLERPSSSSLSSFVKRWKPNLVSHIFGDSFIRGQRANGASLEGIAASDIFPSVIRFLSENLSDERAPEQLPQVIESLRAAAEFDSWQKGELARYRTLLRKKKGRKAEECKKRYLEAMIEKIRSLAVGEELLITGGWCSYGGGHALLYSIIRQEGELYAMRLFNTGADISFHSTVQMLREEEGFSFVQTKILPVVEKKGISIEAIACEEVWLAHFEMKGGRDLERSHNYSARDIYGRFLPLIGEGFSSPPIAGGDEESLFMGEQRSGTCSWKSFIAYIRLTYGLTVAKYVNHRTRVGSLQEVVKYYHELENFWEGSCSSQKKKERAILQGYEYACFLEKCLETYARSIQREVERERLPLKEAREELLPLIDSVKSSYLPIIRRGSALARKSLPSPSLRSVAPFSLQLVHNEMISGVRRDEKAPSLPSSSFFCYRPMANALDWSPRREAISEELSQIIEEVKKGGKADDYFGVKLYLRQIFYRLPPPGDKSFWHLLSPGEAEECLEKLTQLAEWYGRSMINTIDRTPEPLIDRYHLQKCLALSHQLYTICSRGELGIVTLSTCWFTHDPKTGRGRGIFSFVEDPVVDDHLSEVLAYLRRWGEGTAFADPSGWKNFHSERCQLDKPPLPDSDTLSEEERILNFLRLHGEIVALVRRRLEEKNRRGDGEVNDGEIVATVFADLRGEYLPKTFCLLRRQAYFSQIAAGLQSTASDYSLYSIIAARANPPEMEITIYPPCDKEHNPFKARISFPKGERPSSHSFSPKTHPHQHMGYSFLSHGGMIGQLLEKRLGSGLLQFDKPEKGVSEQNYALSKRRKDRPRSECEREIEQLFREDDPSLQIVKAVAFFTKELSRVQSLHLRLLFRELLFERGVLRKTLQKSPGTAFIVQNFMVKAMRACRAERNGAGIAFFLEIARSFDSFCDAILPQEKALLPTFPDALEIIKGFFNNGGSEEKERYTLLLAKVRIYAERRDFTKEQAKELLHSALQLKEMAIYSDRIKNSDAGYFEQAEIKIDQALRRLVEAAAVKEKMSEYSRAVVEFASECYPEIVSKEAALLWDKKTFPLIKSEDGCFAVDLQTGRVHIREGKKRKIPHWLRDNQKFKQLFPNLSELRSITALGRACSFIDASGALNKTYELTGNRVLDKIMGPLFTKIIDGEEYLFQGGNIELFRGDHLYKLDKMLTLWSRRSPHQKGYLIENRSGKALFLLDGMCGEILSVDKEDHRAGTSLVNKESLGKKLALFSAFDSYWRGWQSAASELLHIDFPSYALDFSLQKIGKRRRWVCRQDPSFFLAESQQLAPLPHLEGALIVESCRGEKKAWIPDLPTVARGFYGYVAMDQESNCSSSLREILTYDLQRDGTLSCRSNRERLQLAYLQLSAKNYEEALRLLREVELAIPKQGERESHSTLEPFTAAEGKIIERIIKSASHHGDIHPFALALRMEAAYLYASNRKNYLNASGGHFHGLCESVICDNYEKYIELLGNMGKFALKRQHELFLLEALQVSGYYSALELHLRKLKSTLSNDEFSKVISYKEPCGYLNWHGSPNLEYLHCLFTAPQSKAEEGESIGADLTCRFALITRPTAEEIKNIFYTLYDTARFAAVESPKSKQLHNLLSIWRLPLEGEKSWGSEAAHFLEVVSANRSYFQELERDDLKTFISLYRSYRCEITAEGEGFFKDYAAMKANMSRSPPKYWVERGCSKRVKERATYKKTPPFVKIALAPFPDKEPLCSPDLSLIKARPSREIERITGDVESIIRRLERKIPLFAKELYISSEIERMGSDLKKYLHTLPEIKWEVDARAIEPLLQKFTADIDRADALLDEESREILVMANRSTDAFATLHRDLRLRGGMDEPLTLNSLIALFAQKDASLFQQKNPSLAMGDIEALNQKIGNYLLIATEKQHKARVVQKVKVLKEAVNKRKIERGDPEYDNLCDALVKELTATRHFLPHEEPELLVVEYQADILLYECQVKSVAAFLRGGKMERSVQQLIMGTGKSLVIVPLRALKKASDGKTLSIVMVPEPLVDGAARDLQVHPGALYSQVAHRINWKDTSPEGLQNIASRLYEIKSSRGLLLAVAKELHLFALRAREARLHFEKCGSGKERLTLFREVLDILKRDGDLLIDEIDQVLTPRQEVHIAYGERKKIVQERHDIAAFLYGCLLSDTIRKKYSFDCIREKSENAIPYNPQECDNFKALLIDEVVQNLAFFTFPGKNFGRARDVRCRRSRRANSENPIGEERSPADDASQPSEILPGKLNKAQNLASDEEGGNPLFSLPIAMKLRSYIDGDEGKIAFVKSYLGRDSHQQEELYSRYIALDQELQSALATLKAEIQETLPLTLNRNHREHYGVFEGEIFSGPFSAPDTPKIGSEHGSYREIENYTLQSYMKMGIPVRIIESLLLEVVRKEARAEISYRRCSLEETEAFERLRSLCRGIPVQKLSTYFYSAPKCFVKEVAREINRDLFSVVELTRSAILPHLKIFSERLSHNGYQLVDLFRNCQGCTGTPWNIDLLDDAFTPMVNDASNGEIAYTFWKASAKKILTTKATEGKALLEEIFAEESVTNFHALIDAGALFKDVANRDVAKMLLKKASERNPSIQGAVYYEGNQIMLLSNDQEPLPFVKGALPLSNYVTYYDPSHATGSDIAQAADGVGLLTLNKNSSWRDITQAAWRMRLIGKGQSIGVILPRDLEQVMRATLHLKEGEAVEIDDFILYTLIVQAREVTSMSPLATRKKMESLLYRRSNAILNSVPIERLSEEHFAALDALFIAKISDEPEKEFGLLEQEIDSKKAMEAFASALLHDIDNFFESYAEKIAAESALFAPLLDLKKAFEEVGAKAQKILPERVLARGDLSRDTSVETTVDQQQSVEQEQKIAQRQEEEQVQEMDSLLDKAKKGCAPLKSIPWIEVFSPGREELEKLLKVQLFSPQAVKEGMEPHSWRTLMEEGKGGGRVYSLADLLRADKKSAIPLAASRAIDKNILSTLQFLFSSEDFSIYSATQKSGETLLVSKEISTNSYAILLLSGEEAESLYQLLCLTNRLFGKRWDDYALFLYNPYFGIALQGAQKREVSERELEESREFQELLLQIKVFVNGTLFLTSREQKILRTYLMKKCPTIEALERVEKYFIDIVLKYRFKERNLYNKSHIKGLFSSIKNEMNRKRSRGYSPS